MVTIYVCIGSSCHLKGSYEVINKLQLEISILGIDKEVEIKGSFCLGHCTNAVSVKIDDQIFSLSPANTSQFVKEYLLSKIESCR